MEELKRSGELELVKTTPGSYLGSCRYKLPKDLTTKVYPKLFERFKEYDIGYFFYIGGNDSMDTVSKLSRYAEMVGSDICFLGIPKTIDNDLPCTERTFGLTQQWRWLQKLWIGSIQRQNPIIALWRWKLWDVMLAGSHCIPA